MATGANLTIQQVNAAVAYNKARPHVVLAAMKSTLSPGSSFPKGTTVPVDATFVRGVADWQEKNVASGAGDGRITARTEANLGIQHTRAMMAFGRADAIRRAGNVLFDSWSNDVRDNDNDGVVDGTGAEYSSRTQDGTHNGRVYTSFSVIAGTYSGLGWNLDQTLKVSTSRVVTGAFRYRVCADVISQAYHEAGVMPTTRSTAMLVEAFRKKGYVWRKSEEYPKEFLPGDFICTLGAHGGHSGIVVDRSSTNNVPRVVELPGPSTVIDLREYDPARTNDIRLGEWTKAMVSDTKLHYLGRLLYSKIGD